MATFDGGSGDETYSGTADADSAHGNGGADILAGGAGGDEIEGGDGDDALYAGTVSPAWNPWTDPSVAPLLDTGIEVDTLKGGAGDDFLYGGYGDTIDGGSGNDVLVLSLRGATSGVTADFRVFDTGGSGSLTIGGGTISNIELINWVEGSNFDDVLTGNHNGTGTVQMFGLDGNDKLVGGATTRGVYGGNGDDLLRVVSFNTGGAYGYGEAGNDTLSGNWYARLYGGDGDDVISGGAVGYGGSGNDTLSASADYSSLYGFFGEDGDDHIVGNVQHDIMYGGAGADLLEGKGGDDGLLSAGPNGADTGLEHDVLKGGDGSDVLVFGYGDDADGGAGVDSLWLDATSGGAALILDFTLAQAAIAAGGGTIDNFEGVQIINCTRFGDTVTLGLQYPDTPVAASVHGNEGNDRLTATVSTGVFYGGTGADTLTGGSAYDSLHGDDDNDVLRANGGNDALEGGNGNDILDGGTGGDDMAGGMGDDYYYVDEAAAPGQPSDQVIELDGEGYDVVESSVDFALFNTSVEMLILTGTSALSGTGNDSANTIVGNSANNTLDGRGGDDRLYGGGGNDTYTIESAGDLIFENAGGGTDTVYSYVSHYMFANVETLWLRSDADLFGVGNDLDNLIYGTNGANLLLGGLGNDYIQGDWGNDSLYGQDGDDHMNGGQGIDYLVGGAGSDEMWGDEDADALYGEAGDDYLTGGEDFKTDILVGGEGSDTLRGDGGMGDYDLMDGGAGNDNYYVDSGDDLTFEAADGGFDVVYANVSGANNGVYLYANVEWLILEGSTAFGVGNGLDNYLQGNDAANWLLGGAGNDRLFGGAGNDVLFGEAGSDRFAFRAGTGADVIGDFQLGVDQIDLTAFGLSWQTVLNSMHENNGTTAIDLGNGDMIVINGVAASALTQADFILSWNAPQVELAAPPVASATIEIEPNALIREFAAPRYLLAIDGPSLADPFF